MRQVARAAERRIALLQADPELRRAIALSLSPWGVDTVQSDVALPEASLPRALLQAVQLARQLGVDAVVWVSTSHDGSVLWVYDTRTEKITTRVLEGTPPFESSRAAAIALSVKTVLRASVVAPPAERFGATKPTPARTPDRFALESGLEAWFPAQRAAVPRLSLGGVLWLTPGRWLGAGLAFSASRDFEVRADGFRGHYREQSLASELRLRFADQRLLAASAWLGAALHVAALEGALTADSAAIEVHRVNASFDAGLRVDLKLRGAAYLGLDAQAGYLAGYQRYLVDGAPVFSLWPVALAAGGHCGVALF